MAEPERTYSIVVRVRRTIVEEVHVWVPVTQDVVTDDHVDGSKVFAAAVQIGATGVHRWRAEGDPVVEIHPVQTPPPEYDN